MKYYQDITLLPDAEISAHFLWERLYGDVHLALVKMQDASKRVGVAAAFPHYIRDPKQKKYGLGNKLRLLAATAEELEKLDINRILARFSDYLHITSIKDINSKQVTGYACFKRLQFKGNNEKLARRKAKRENMSYEQALAFLDDKRKVKQDGTTPFIRIKSASSGQSFPLIIEQIEQDVSGKNSEKNGFFSAYGLSPIHAVPLF